MSAIAEGPRYTAPMADSDAVESVEEWKERVGVGQPSLIGRRSDSGPGTKRMTKVLREDKSGVAGVQTTHWDGRSDASVFPETTSFKSKSTV